MYALYVLRRRYMRLAGSNIKKKKNRTRAVAGHRGGSGGGTSVFAPAGRVVACRRVPSAAELLRRIVSFFFFRCVGAICMCVLREWCAHVYVCVA